MFKRGSIIIILSTLAIVLSFGISYPTTILLMDLKQLYHSSNAILIGQIKSVDSKWSAGKNMIFTLVTLDVSDSLKGGTNNYTRFIIPGGRVGDIGVKIHGVPAFERNERVLLFMQDIENPINDYKEKLIPTITSYALGKYTIYQDPTSGVDMIKNDLSNVSIVENRKGELVPYKKGGTKKPLSDFIKEIDRIREED